MSSPQRLFAHFLRCGWSCHSRIERRLGRPLDDMISFFVPDNLVSCHPVNISWTGVTPGTNSLMLDISSTAGTVNSSAQLSPFLEIFIFGTETTAVWDLRVPGGSTYDLVLWMLDDDQSTRVGTPAVDIRFVANGTVGDKCDVFVPPSSDAGSDGGVLTSTLLALPSVPTATHSEAPDSSETPTSTGSTTGTSSISTVSQSQTITSQTSSDTGTIVSKSPLASPPQAQHSRATAFIAAGSCIAILIVVCTALGIFWYRTKHLRSRVLWPFPRPIRDPMDAGEEKRRIARLLFAKDVPSQPSGEGALGDSLEIERLRTAVARLEEEARELRAAGEVESLPSYNS
ncbi:hypothetical protein EXIGLDRAFT_764233 [Exidia glandulosa HHB12029]|uniref:Uncharacterized protein n=1 Tax=Exidia glandulosa HHB12029 TaxID=1314781 RepID=A0A165L9V5_EXIGL|nr:hypothetical protein EXIGLDRAFT_764233 [Exidia glandulosa HHB12029]